MRCRTIALIPAYEPDAKIKDLTKELTVKYSEEDAHFSDVLDKYSVS